jgi:tetratricopeptide (TPR) repeat protein
VVVVYARSLGNGPVWDDSLLVLDNRAVGSLSGIWRVLGSDLWSASALGEPSSFYRPLAMASYWLNAIVLGQSPWSMHLGNVLVHALNTILLVVLLRRVTEAGPIAACAGALFWALAPVVSEPVLWISGRFDPLTVTFALSCLLCARGRGASWLVPALFACGLLCKESFALFAPVLLVDDLVVRRAPLRSLLAKYAAVALLLLGYVGARRLAGVVTADAAMAIGPVDLARSFLFLVSVYTRELVWPAGLDTYRAYHPPSIAATLLGGAVLVALVAALIASVARRPAATGPRAAALGAAWFVFGLLPCAVTGPRLEMVGDRYAHLPAVGLVIILCACAAPLARGARLARAAAGMAALVLVLEAAVVQARTRDFRDDTSLAEASLRSDPDGAYAQYVLGRIAIERGDFAGADRLLTRSLASNPRGYRAHNAVCYLRLQQGRWPEAERACIKSLSIHGANPRAWVNLGYAYVQTKRWPAVADAADKALALKPSYPEGHYLAALSCANLGQLDEAHRHIAAGLAIDPEHRGLRDLRAQIERAASP